jgi:O-antigen/teichoic acid export membrane protein
VSRLNITGTNLVHNTVLNFMGQALPLVVGVLVIPFIIRSLGTERFGILTLAWIVIGYFSLFDMGLSRATTKFVAEIIALDEIEKLPAVVWTSLYSLLFLGVASGTLLAFFAPFLVEHFFNISAVLSGETKTTFLLLSLSIPLVVGSAGLRGVLEAGQHFGVVNTIFIPLNTMNFLAPVVGILLGFHLPGIVSLMVLVRFCAVIVCLLVCLCIYPMLKKYKTFDKTLIRPLLTFGGWVAASNILGPILMYIDRLLIAALLTMSALTYYTTPYEIVTRLWAIPMSIVTTLFPAFSGIDALGDKAVLRHIFIRSSKYLILILFPLILVFVLFSETILSLWIGPEFAKQSSGAMKVLAIGTFINSLGWIPYSFLMALGRPDIQVKIILFELPIFAGLAFILLKGFGIEGVAVAWSILAAMYSFLAFWATRRLFGLSPKFFLEREMLKTTIPLSVIALGLIVATPFCISMITQVFAVLIFLLTATGTTWYFSFDHEERMNIIFYVTNMLRFKSSRDQ